MKKSIIKCIVIVIALLAITVSGCSASNNDHYGVYVGSGKITIDETGITIDLGNSGKESYANYTISDTEIKCENYTFYRFENGNVLSQESEGNATLASAIFNFSLDVPPRNGTFSGEWIAYDTSYGAIRTIRFFKNGNFDSMKYGSSSYEGGHYTIKDGVIILNYKNYFTDMVYDKEIYYVDKNNNIHLAVNVKNLDTYNANTETDNNSSSIDGNNNSNKQYTITYDYNDGTGRTDTQHITSGENFTLKTIERRGYTLNGWLVDYNNSIITSGVYYYNMDITVIANWEKATYNITYEKNGGEFSNGTYTAFDIDDEAFTLATPKKTGYTFLGWYENLDFSGEPITEINPSTIELKDYMLYAKWKGNQCTITFYDPYNVANGGDSIVGTQTVVSGEYFTLNIPTRKGYTFVRWYNYYNQETITSGIYNYGDQLKLYAEWKINVYSIEYNKNGGEMPQLGVISSYKVTNSAFSLPEPNKTNYEFCGWYENPNFDGEPISQIDPNTMELKNYVLYAKWVNAKYTITYQHNIDDEIINPQTVVAGENFYLVLPSKKGYSFDGWYLQTTEYKIVDGIWYLQTTEHKIVDGIYDYGKDICLVAKWNVIEYHIDYMLDGGELPSETKYTYTIDDLPYTLPIPAKDSCIFLEWQTSSATNISEITENNLQNYTIYAKYDDNLENYLTFIEVQGGYTIAKCIGDYKHLTIPQRYQDLPVVSIYDNAFQDSNINSITIPNSIASIGANAFYNCTKLTNIVIPNSVTVLSEKAFANCSSLSTVIFEENSGLSYVDPSVFSNCQITNLTASTTLIPYIPQQNLVDVVINGGENIDESLFSNLNNLESVTMQSDIESIANNAFDSCAQLTNITIENYNLLKDVSKTAFVNCKKLESIVDNNVNYIKINENPYFLAIELIVKIATTCDIKNDCKIIANNAFDDCSQLTKIVIPSTIVNIGQYSFVNCPIKQAEIPTDFISFIPKNNLTTVTINCGETIKDSAFDNCSSLASITIPNSVTSIGNRAFYGCSNLTTITFEDNSQLTNIDAYAFYKCNKLTSITIPASVTSIGSSAFDGFYNLTTVNYSGTLEQWLNISFGGYEANPCYYGAQLYIDGTLLTGELVIPDTIIEIKDYAFWGCTSITSATIPASVTSIGGGAFVGCDNLTTVTFEENSQLTSIGNHAFENCDNLTSITIPASVTSIGERAFHSCSNLTTVTFEENSQLTSIGYRAFEDCRKLNSITIPASVTSIGERAFFCCYRLTSITIPASVTSICNYAFFDCSNLTDIYYTGTEEQWNAISKEYNWHVGAGNYTIHYNYVEE